MVEYNWLTDNFNSEKRFFKLFGSRWSPVGWCYYRFIDTRCILFSKKQWSQLGYTVPKDMKPYVIVTQGWWTRYFYHFGQVKSRKNWEKKVHPYLLRDVAAYRIFLEKTWQEWVDEIPF